MKIEFTFNPTPSIDGLHKTLINTIEIEDDAPHACNVRKIENHISRVISDGQWIFYDAQILDGPYKGRNVLDIFPIDIKGIVLPDRINPTPIDEEVMNVLDNFGNSYRGSSGFYFGNVIYHLLQTGDLKAAKWYLERLINIQED